MTLQSSGPIDFGQINTELGYPVYAMTVFNTKLYAGMAPHGNLYEFT